MTLKFPEDVEDVPGAYVIINSRGTRAYVGSSGELRTRLRSHRATLERNEHHNAELTQLYKEEDGELYVILFLCEDREQAFDIEQSLLDDKTRSWKLCNIATDVRLPRKGGELADWHKEKLFRSRLGSKHTEETKRRISEVQIGKVISLQTRERMSAARKGRKHSDQHREAIRASLKGRMLTPGSIERLRQFNLGKKHSKEHLAKMSAAMKGINAKAIEIDGIRYSGAPEASEKLGVKITTIHARVNNPNFPTWKKLT